jgi:parvulin-like peptidyl-prolyl isomerase
MRPTQRLSFGLLSAFWCAALAWAVPQAAPAGASTSQSTLQDTLAVAGSRAITAADLVERIEWMPWPDKQRADMDSAKVRALQSLVGEALLAGEARRQALGDSGRVAAMRTSLEKALVRDALYRQVVADVPAPATAEVDRIVRRQAPHASPAERGQLRRAVADSLRALSVQERAMRFMGGVLGSQRAVVDSVTFMRLADSLRRIMASTQEERVTPKGFALRPEDVEILLVRLAPWLEHPLVELPREPLRLGDAIQDLRLYAWLFRSLERRRFALELSAHLKDLVAGELMAREGMRRHLDRNPDVRRDLAMWSNAWRANLLLMRLAAGPGASDDEAFRRFATFEPERALGASEIDVEEILPLEPQAREIQTSLGSGARFDSLARRVSTRSEWRDRGGRSGFFRASLHPELGRALRAPLDCCAARSR